MECFDFAGKQIRFSGNPDSREMEARPNATEHTQKPGNYKVLHMW